MLVTEDTGLKAYLDNVIKQLDGEPLHSLIC
jgi:hypothetical protein